MLCNAMGVGGVKVPEKVLRFNIISANYERVGVKFLEKNCYVTLDCPPSTMYRGKFSGL